MSSEPSKKRMREDDASPDDKALPDDDKALPDDDKALPDDDKALPDDDKALPDNDKASQSKKARGKAFWTNLVEMRDGMQ